MSTLAAAERVLPDPTDEQLAATVQGQPDSAAGQAAFAALFGRHYEAQADRVRGKFVSLSPDAEDVAQVGLWKAWQSMPRFNSEKASFRTWLNSIVTYTAVDAYRRLQATRTTPMEPAIISDHEAAVPASADTDIALLDVREMLADLSDKLPSDELRCMVGSAVGATHIDLAEAYAIPLGTVKSRLRIGYGRVRAELPAEDFNDYLAA